MIMQCGTLKLDLNAGSLRESLHFKIFDSDSTKQAYFSVNFVKPFATPPLVITSICGLVSSPLAPGSGAGGGTS